MREKYKFLWHTMTHWGPILFRHKENNCLRKGVTTKWVHSQNIILTLQSFCDKALLDWANTKKKILQYWSFLGESTDDWCIPFTKGQ